jgi:hypothetical protein
MMMINRLVGIALVALTLSTAAFANHNTQTPADRRAAADALNAFADALRSESWSYKQRRVLAGCQTLRATTGFTNGDQYLTNAYYTALYGRDSDLRNARNWLNSYLYVGTTRFNLSTADVAKVWTAIHGLMDFERYDFGPSKLTQALQEIRDTQAFGLRHSQLSIAINQLGTALERRSRGAWWLPFTARYDARRAQNTLRSALEIR